MDSAAADQPAQTPRCLGCDYPLLSLPENRCPECGRGFDPDDPRTVRTPQSPGKFAQFLLKPPGWPMFSAIGVASLISFIADMGPGRYFELSALATLSWMFIIALWAARLYLWGCVRNWYRQDCVLGPRHPRKWLVMPTALIVIIALAAGNIPFKVAFWLSR